MTGAFKITGATRLYGILGDPIVQVRSPEVYTTRFAAVGLDAVLVPLHVPAAKFDTAMPALLALGNLHGLLVTAPFKARMLAFADRLGPTSQAIAAVNALRRETDGSWSGDMFDGVGFLRGVEGKGETVRGRRVALFGAGGAGSAIACELLAAGAVSLEIIEVAPARAADLARRLGTIFPKARLEVAARMSPEVDMVVNASTVGMRPGDPMPAEIGPLRPDTLVGDVVITESPTALIRHAMSCGCRWVDGKSMHSGQIDAIMRFFAADASAAGDPVEPARPSRTGAPGSRAP